MTYILYLFAILLFLSAVLFVYILYRRTEHALHFEKEHEVKEEFRHIEHTDNINEVKDDVKKILNYITADQVIDPSKFNQLNVKNRTIDWEKILNDSGFKSHRIKEIEDVVVINFGVFFEKIPISFLIAKEKDIDEVLISSFVFSIPFESKDILFDIMEQNALRPIGSIVFVKNKNGYFIKVNYTFDHHLLQPEVIRKYITSISNTHKAIREYLEIKEIKYSMPKGKDLIQILE